MTKCETAHPDDRTPCRGRMDAVLITDGHGAEVPGCVHHAARLYATLDAPLVLPGTVDGAPSAVIAIARTLRPFEVWHDDDPAMEATEAPPLNLLLAIDHLYETLPAELDKLTTALRQAVDNANERIVGREDGPAQN